MKLPVAHYFHRGRAGFTIIETAMAIALTGIIGLGASVAFLQVSNQTSYNSDFTTASRQAMNAIHWLGQDVQMAQTVTGADGFPATSDLELSWKWWDNTVYSVNYTLENGSLRRSYSDGSNQQASLVAEYISNDPDWTNCVSQNGTLTFTITASVGEGVHTVNVTRTREVSARPHL